MERERSSGSAEGGQISKKKHSGVNIMYLKGFPFPGSTPFNEKNILSALNYSPLDDDLIISSYPNTGTNWVDYVILQILHRGEVVPTIVELHQKLAPFMEGTGASAAECLSPPRFMKFHLPFHLIPFNKNAKYIYVVRNPKDVVLSYYCFRQGMVEDDVSFNEFFDFFMSGEIPFGDCLEHMKSWILHRDDHNVLLICYEKLKADFKNEVLRIARYLGEKHYDSLKENDELFNEILKRTSGDYMNKNLAFKPMLHDVNATSSEQKTGVSGDWENHLSPEQTSLLDEKMHQILGEGDLLTLWKS